METVKRQAKKSFFILLLIMVISLDAAGYSGGSGTAEDPYQIATKADLLALAAEPNDYSKCFILTADIDMEGQVFTTAIIAADTQPSFRGMFDGNSHKITDFTINGEDCLGLFGHISGSGGVVKNLGVENFTISSSGFSQYVGGLVGENNYATISNCYATGTVSGSWMVGGLVGYNRSSISQCYTTGTVSGTSYCVGGLVGYNHSGSISQCYSADTVSGSSWSSSVGGLVGENRYGSISGCCSMGAVSGDEGVSNVGGLVGRNIGSVSVCYSTGAVSGDEGVSNVGGLVGYSGGSTGSSISDCYATGVVNGSPDSYSVGGLVGFNDYSSKIRQCYSTGEVSGSSCVGGLVGENYGSINQCYSYSTGLVSGTSYYVGGLVGVNSGSIGNCYSMSEVSSSAEFVGGLVGYNSGSINNCCSTGIVSGYSYVGGLVGYNDYNGGISQCYSTGAVNGDYGVGGLVGFNEYGIIANSYWDTQTSGQNYSNGGEGKTTEQMQDINTFLNAGWDFVNETTNGTCNYWQMPTGGGYPVLSIFDGYIPPEPLGSGTEVDPYIITDANDLGTIWYRPWSDYVLANDINLAGIEWSVAVVPAFSGVLNGNGFCIRNLSIDGGGFLGLFGWISFGGKVENFGLENSTVSGSSNSHYVGGLAGNNNGSISNCYSRGAVSVSSYSGYIGGLVGYNCVDEYGGGGSISNCYSTGQVSGESDVGGLVGSHYSGSISQCYSTCLVIGDSNAGGLVGYNVDNNTVVSSFWDMNTSGWMTSAGGEGKTTAEMKTLSTFTSAGWDFTNETVNGDNNIWRMCVDGVDYPRLNWESTDGDFACPDGVNIEDLEYSVQQWLLDNCTLSNNYCGGADIDGSGVVDLVDFAIFAQHWLEGF